MSTHDTQPDPLLAPLLAARGEGRRAEVIERLVVDIARPVVAGVLSRFGSGDGALTKDDLDDLAATVMLRLVAKLQRVGSAGEEPIRQFRDYVATLAFNAAHDLLRQRFPEPRRLRNRIQYALSHDPRFAIWPTPEGPAAGLRAWNGQKVRREQVALTRPRGPIAGALETMQTTGEALATVFAASGGPVLLDQLFRLLLGATTARAVPPPTVPTDVDPAPLCAVTLERRDQLQHLWREIEALRPQHRAALLLNLRDAAQGNVLALFVVTGVASFEQIAATLGLTTAALQELWERLPLDDHTIASMLGTARQTVINLRYSARLRLLRRLSQPAVPLGGIRGWTSK